MLFFFFFFFTCIHFVFFLMWSYWEGQERYGNMTRVYYREAVGALIVFDVTRASTFDAVQKWKDDLDLKVSLGNGKPVPTVLLANKSDQSRESLRSQIPKLDTFCKENGFVGWFETSAKDNTNIETAAKCLVDHILAHEENIISNIDPDVVALPGYNNTTKERVRARCKACSKF
ncbi:ras-related protein Rab-38 isoform X2 [Carassius carassius]|uniref:ras-related protein Rab-38 isoform X2 n=1 Tax=Carassius carassius TaxID=217509 RepID=UPI0028687026|nr:ras-related protein Rab-38 isoform X2 [Carassius carassius]